MDLTNLANRPLKLKHNRVYRPFMGGKLLDEWQGVKNPQDAYKAEEWVASTVEARNTKLVPGEGLSLVELDSGYTEFLKEIIQSSPSDFLGERHELKYGNNTAVLVKVLDSCSRLLIQVHPDKEYARNMFSSDFGKTEAWHILGGRWINGQEPYVLLGFKPWITKEKWVELFKKQDIKRMEEALHKFYVKPGDVFFVEGGVPHAAGAGCFFMEIQEPTDYTMRTERINPMGLKLSDEQLHQGVGFDKMFDCFHYNGYTEEEIMEKWFIKPSMLRQEQGGKEIEIISPSYTPYFSMKRLEVDECITTSSEGTFSVAVVVSGKGKVIWNGGEMDIGQSDEYFLPASLDGLKWMSQDGKKLEIILCYPPG